MEVMLTPRFFDVPVLAAAQPATAWSPTKAEPNQYVSLAFFDTTDPVVVKRGSGGGVSPWNPHATTVIPPSTTSSDSSSDKAAKSEEPPAEVLILVDDESDAVSLLCDDPDEDDDQLLPSSTYDVLVPLLDEMYKDETEHEDEMAVAA